MKINRSGAGLVTHRKTVQVSWREAVDLQFHNNPTTMYIYTATPETNLKTVMYVSSLYVAIYVSLCSMFTLNCI